MLARYGWKLTVAFIAVAWITAGLIWGRSCTERREPALGPYTLGTALYWRRCSVVAMGGCRGAGIVTASGPDLTAEANAVTTWIDAGMPSDSEAWARFWLNDADGREAADAAMRARCRSTH